MTLSVVEPATKYHTIATAGVYAISVSDTKVLLIADDSAVIADTTNSTVSLGTLVSFTDKNPVSIAAVKMNNENVVIIFSINTANELWAAHLFLNLATNTITIPTENMIASSSFIITKAVKATKISDTKIFATFQTLQGSNWRAEGVVVTYSSLIGGTVDHITDATTSGSVIQPNIVAISSTKVYATWRENGTHKASILTIYSTTFTRETSVSISASDAEDDVCLKDSIVIFGSKAITIQNGAKYIATTFSGITPSPGLVLDLPKFRASLVSAGFGKFFSAYSSGTNGQCSLFTLSGTTITQDIGQLDFINSTNSRRHIPANLADNAAVIAYSIGNSCYVVLIDGVPEDDVGTYYLTHSSLGLPGVILGL